MGHFSKSPKNAIKTYTQKIVPPSPGTFSKAEPPLIHNVEIQELSAFQILRENGFHAFRHKLILTFLEALINLDKHVLLFKGNIQSLVKCQHWLLMILTLPNLISCKICVAENFLNIKIVVMETFR